ncbi:hypothetical protein pdam_00023074 [Pocillopora damicornis]|uniref:Uncharacterized protein n=1 Tax=Pocillopora damicornis TaxID=46731 RepID=A0A3M6V0P6_POCDA|nr:hypothetical protein pdam_00023074 [Pocillopora damicornis]
MGANEFSGKPDEVPGLRNGGHRLMFQSNLAEAMSPATPQGIVLHYYCQCLPSTDQQRRKRLRHAELPLQLHVGHRISFPNCGILIANNFNRLDMSCFCNAFQLKQIVKF